MIWADRDEALQHNGHVPSKCSSKNSPIPHIFIQRSHCIVPHQSPSNWSVRLSEIRCIRSALKHIGMPRVFFIGKPLKILGFVIPVSFQLSSCWAVV